MNGKGDTPRPRQISYEEYSANWDRVFGKKTPSQQPAPKADTPKQEQSKE